MMMMMHIYGTNSKQQTIRTGVPQGAIISPTLFNLYTSDLPEPPINVKLNIYTDDINIFTSHRTINAAEQAIQPYLNQIYDWTRVNNLQLNPTKSTSTLFTPYPAEYKHTLNLTINNVVIPTLTHPKILGVTFDPKLTFNEHTKKTQTKATTV